MVLNTGNWCVYAEVVKNNPNTQSATKKDMEVELRKWFGNARDRGSDNRKMLKVRATTNSDSVSQSSSESV